VIRANVSRSPRIRQLSEALRLTPEAARSVGDACDFRLRANETALFQSEGASGGPKWAPLSPPYAAAKERAYQAKGSTNRAAKKAGGKPTRRVKPSILVLTGLMRDALTRTQDASTSAGTARHESFVFSLGPSKWFWRGGATGPAYFEHASRERDPIQQTPEQVAAYQPIIAGQLLPHIQRAFRVLAQAASLRRSA
jgi:hypothetical protein